MNAKAITPMLTLCQARNLGDPRVTRPVDPRLLRYLLRLWEPERPELLLRLRPRPREVSHGGQSA